MSRYIGIISFLFIIAGAQAMAETELKPLKPLTDMQKYVTQHDGTEPPFQNEYWDHKEEGIYVDVTTGEALFFIQR